MWSGLACFPGPTKASMTALVSTLVTVTRRTSACAFPVTLPLLSCLAIGSIASQAGAPPFGKAGVDLEAPREETVLQLLCSLGSVIGLGGCERGPTLLPR